MVDKKATWQELENILTFIINNDGSTKKIIYGNEIGTCGAHVHVGRNMFNKNPDGWLTFFKFWYVFEDIIYKFTNGELYHVRDSFTTKANKISHICSQILLDYELLGEINASKLCNDKRNCINLNPKYDSSPLFHITNKISRPKEQDKSKTIEFRSPNGTLNNIIWQNNVNFFTKLLLACSDSNFDIERLDYLYLHKSNATVYDLVDLVFSEELDKLCFLRQYYKDFSGKEKGISYRFWK